MFRVLQVALGKRRTGRTVRHDPVFGPIEFEARHGVETWCTPGDGPFPQVIVCAPATGPTHEQQAFFEQVQARLSELESECRAFVASHAVAPCDANQLTMYSIVIPEGAGLARKEFCVELSDDRAEAIHVIEYRGGGPTVYGLDD